MWGHGGFKVFLSHLAQDKEEVSELQKQLEVFGVSCFVAHLNIRPTKEWQEELETALFSMDALIAILTRDFQKSNWTDQEIGIALGRKVPVIPLKIPKNPYGFIGKIQAIPYLWDAPATKIIKYLMKYDKMVDAYLSAVHHCPNFESGLKLAEILPFLENLSDKQIEILISAFNQNSQVSGCWGFSGDYSSSKYGKGLVFHLNRLTGKTYVRNASDKIVIS
ncbi:MAG: toll/interleukin-1 receptor domain-containing protein [Candidatus Paracaedibacter sp.]